MRREALIVGINQYPFLKDTPTSKAKHLTTPASDAEVIAQLLERHGEFRVKRFPSIIIKDKLQVDANKSLKTEELRQAIIELFLPTTENPPETALLFFAGHGLRKIVNQNSTWGFLGASDSNPSKEDRWGFSLQDLWKILQDSSVQQQIIWLDCCFAGELFNFKDSELQQQSFGCDRFLIAASRSYEVAYQQLDGKHGVLSGALLAGLDPRQITKDEWMTSQILSVLVQRNLEKYCNSVKIPQSPLISYHGEAIKLIKGRGKPGATETLLSFAWNDELWDIGEKGSPFLGLETFRPEHTSIFYGRTREIEVLLEYLRRNRFYAIVGASGSGKSSLVWAGVLPRLEKNWIAVYFTPGGSGSGDPFSALFASLIASNQFPQIKQKEPMLAKKLLTDPNLLDTLCDKLLDSNVQVLLFVDQFEELFTLVEPSFQEPFIKFLAQVLKARRLRAIITIRHDFIPSCFTIPLLIDLLQNRDYKLKTPDAFALKEMISRPARAAEISFEQGLIKRILENTDASRNPGSLSLMAYTLQQLYENRQEDQCLTHEVYQLIGGVQGAIAQKAEEVFNDLDQTAQEELSTVFQTLVSFDETNGIAIRQRAFKDIFDGNEAAKQLIDAFIDARLLVSNQDSENLAIIEVAHEAILQNWPRLMEWLHTKKVHMQVLKKLLRDADEWHRGNRPQGYLYRQQQLDLAKQAIKELRPPNIPDYMTAFLRDEWEWLVEELENAETTLARRLEIGSILAQNLAGVADPRPGVGLRRDGLPDIVWCRVNSCQQHLPAIFYIAKYPITNLQYSAFLKAPDGYTNTVWWKGLAKRQNPPEQSKDIGRSNCPAEYISWYDAVAFCRWLTVKLKPVNNSTLPTELAIDFEIRLPIEKEWQNAAQGDDDREYPYGNSFDKTKGNTFQTGIGQTCPVGLFLPGASPCGALDISGNVQEWTITNFDTPSNLSLNVDDPRTIRGGSWNYNQNYARTTSRNWSRPDARVSGIGFRLCYSVAIS